MLDIQSTSQGVLFPRLTTAQRDAIAAPAEGLMIYNVTTKCLDINLGTSVAPVWMSIKCAESSGGGGSAPSTSSWALVSATDTLYFMDHNLASANTAADPFTPSWEIIGGYWQWGRKGPDASQWLNTNTPNFAHGPTGPNAGDANDAAVSGWSTANAANGAWSDSTKTADDPCPTGFRVPTNAQWDGVLANNTKSFVGSWSSSATNYSSGLFFGPNLMLPAAGDRGNSNGALSYRGSDGSFWSSTENGSDAWGLYFYNGGAGTYFLFRTNGLSVRCAAE